MVVLGGKQSCAPAGMARCGWSIGAGPGDPELLTLKALRALQQADIVVHDGLVSEAILELAPAAARRLSVAKRKSRHSYAQDEINRMLVAFALDGQTGRGAAERRRSVHLRPRRRGAGSVPRGGRRLPRRAGHHCGVGCGRVGRGAADPSRRPAGCHLRNWPRGRRRGERPDLDWAALAKANQTVVIYMGVSTAPAIATRLMAADRAGSTPALIVEDASLPTERRIVTTLAGLADAATGIEGPALLIVGEAMALALPSSLPLVGRDDDAEHRRVGTPTAVVPSVTPTTLTASPSLHLPAGGGEGGGSMKALTGNRLEDGEAVFLGRGGDWVPRFADAELYEDDDAAMAAEAHAKTFRSRSWSIRT